MILHIVEKTEWEKAIKNDVLSPSSLQTEGFIHCSTIEQVIDVANFFFKGFSSELLLLCIEENKISSKIVYEDLSDSGELFPHIYGPLNIDSVSQVLDFKPGRDGRFALPPGIVV